MQTSADIHNSGTKSQMSVSRQSHAPRLPCHSTHRTIRLLHYNKGTHCNTSIRTRGIIVYWLRRDSVMQVGCVATWDSPGGVESICVAACRRSIFSSISCPDAVPATSMSCVLYSATAMHVNPLQPLLTENRHHIQLS